MPGQQPNALAFIALSLFPLVAFLVAKRRRPALAATGLYVGAILFLPQAELIKLPAIPTWTKATIPPIAILLSLRVHHRERFQRIFTNRWPKLALLLAAICAFGTTYTNPEVINWGEMTIPGMVPTDALNVFLSAVLDYFLVFVLGSVAIRSERDLIDMLSVVVVLGLVYSLPILVELRLSPQMNNWTYGFGQHEWIQTLREGGYRPMVYMAHGLALSLFVATALLCAATLREVGLQAFRIDTRWVWIYLAALLALLKSKAALIYGFVGLGLIFFMSPKAQLRVAMVLCFLVLSYPWLRYEQVIRTDSTVQIAQSMFGAERAESVEFRMKNEEVLLERAGQKLLFGWGHNNRASVFPPWGTRALTVRDGAWIIIIGDRGILYWGVFFAILVIPIFHARRHFERIRSLRAQRLVAALALLVGIHTFDLLPNGLFDAMGVYFAGALYSVVPRLARERA